MRIWPSKRTAKRIGIGLVAVIAVLLIANGVMAWRVNSRLESMKAAVRAAGDPASIADLAPEPIPDEENAAFYLEKISDELKACESEYYRWEDKSELGRAYKERMFDDEPPTPEQAEAIRAILEKYPAVTTGIVQAAACDQYASRLDFTLDYHAFLEQVLDRSMLARQVQRHLWPRMVVLMHDGRFDEAARRGIDGIKLSRLREAEPLLLNYLVTLAIRGPLVAKLSRVLSNGELSLETHAQLDEELARCDDSQALLNAIKLERGAAFESMRPALALTGPLPFWADWVDWSITRHYLDALDYYDEVLPLLDGPWHEVLKQVAAGDLTRVAAGHGIMADRFASFLEMAYFVHLDQLAWIRSLRAYNAFHQFALNNDREAEGLDDLRLPREATIDPYSGEPLVVKRTEDDWLVYSVGKNGKDDGGDFEEYKDVGVGPTRNQSQ